MSGAAKKLATIEDVLAAPEGSRIELIDGEIVHKEAVAFEHSDAQLSVGSALRSRYGSSGAGGPGGWIIVTETLVKYDQHQAFQHDLAGWRRERMPEKPKGRPVALRPDWVCEILSPSNWRDDTVRKFRVLFEHKVTHYWIMDVQHQELTVYRWSKEGYIVATKAVPGTTLALEPFEDHEFDISALFGIDPN